MKLLVLTVLLAVMQTAPQAPRITPKEGTNEVKQNNPNPTQNKAPSNTPSATSQQSSSSVSDTAKQRVGEKEPETPITISKLPNVTVEKDRYDYIAIACNVLLFFVGIAGVCAAVSTLKAIKKQAAHMEEQNDKLGKSIALAEETAERQLRAYVCVDSAAMKFPEAAVPEAQVHFRNSGQTPAYDVRGWIHTWFAKCPLTEVLPEAPSDFKKGAETLAPGRHSIFVAPRKPPLAPQFLQILGTPQFTLYVYGEIRYRDAFKKERFTRFRLIHGGTEGTRSVRDKDGVEIWSLKPDTEGNESN